jgi:hypothetical protein
MLLKQERLSKRQFCLEAQGIQRFSVSSTPVFARHDQQLVAWFNLELLTGL